MIVSDETRKWMSMRLRMLGKTYKELANEVGLSFSYIRMILGKRNADVPPQKLNMVLEYLGFDNKKILELNIQEEVKRKAKRKAKRKEKKQNYKSKLLNEIEELMDIWGYKQIDLANELGISKQYISQMFKDKYNFSNKQYERFHKALCDMQRRKVQQMNEDC